MISSYNIITNIHESILWCIFTLMMVLSCKNYTLSGDNFTWECWNSWNNEITWYRENISDDDYLQHVQRHVFSIIYRAGVDKKKISNLILPTIKLIIALLINWYILHVFSQGWWYNHVEMYTTSRYREV